MYTVVKTKKSNKHFFSREFPFIEAADSGGG